MNKKVKNDIIDIENKKTTRKEELSDEINRKTSDT